jgi:hypothetical protein
MITWDEPKRRANLKKLRIDLAELESVFDGPMITVEDAREAYGEARLQSLGFWRGRVIFLVWTAREYDSAHLISCRYADRKETDDYFSALWRGRGRRSKDRRLGEVEPRHDDRLVVGHRDARRRCGRDGRGAAPRQGA